MSDPFEGKGKDGSNVIRLFGPESPGFAARLREFVAPLEGEWGLYQAWAAYAYTREDGRRVVEVLYGPGKFVAQEISTRAKEGNATPLARGAFGTALDLTQFVTTEEREKAIRAYLRVRQEGLVPALFRIAPEPGT